MHRSRYYRNPSMYHSRGDKELRFVHGNGLSQIARNNYRRMSTIPFSSHKRDLIAATHYAAQHSAYNSRFSDRSKYVWTANKQQQSSQQSSIHSQIPQTQVKSMLIKKHINYRDISALSVTVLDPAEAVIRDIAAKLHEEKVYIIRKVVEVIGVKKAIKLFYETRQKEANGGILVQNGKRRRTPGGVFLTLLRESSFIPKNEIEKVFLEIKRHESQLKIAHYHETN